MGDQEEAVRRDPEVQQALKIAQLARARLLECVDAGTLAEAQQMLDALRKATVLAADAEDRARVHVGLLTQAEADRRATERNPPPDGHPARPSTMPPRPLLQGLAFVADHPALTAVLSLVATVAAWLTARTLLRRRKRN